MANTDAASPSAIRTPNANAPTAPSLKSLSCSSANSTLKITAAAHTLIFSLSQQERDVSQADFWRQSGETLLLVIVARELSSQLVGNEGLVDGYGYGFRLSVQMYCAIRGTLAPVDRNIPPRVVRVRTLAPV
jgi:hypothetical protein